MKSDLPTYKNSIDEEHEDIDMIDSVRDSSVDTSEKYKIGFIIAATAAVLFCILTILSFTVFNSDSSQESEEKQPSTPVEASTVTVTQSVTPSSQPVEPSVSTVVETQAVTETVTETQRREVIINDNNTANNPQDNIPPNYIGNGVSTDDSAQTQMR